MQKFFLCVRVRVLIGAQLLVALLHCPTAQAQVKVGAMGDSYSDEYSVLSPGMYNWVDLLVVSGRADFGPLAAFPSGDPRNTGGLPSYTYNYAKGGATTTSALGSTTYFPTVQNNKSQPGSPNRPDIWPGIRGAGTSGAIQFASQEIGGNDLLDQIINQQKLLVGLDIGVMNPILSRFNQITEIATAGYSSPLEMVLVRYPDLGSMPVFGGLPEFSRDSIRQNVQYFNANIDVQAAARGFATVDLFALWDNIRSGGGTTVHGIAISPGTSSGGLADLRSAWLADGLHPTPIFQALWANEFIAALNGAFGQSIAPLTPKEMVTLTGVDPQQNPIATAGASYALAVGENLLLSAAGSTDPNPGDIPLLSYSWDINGDGMFGDATGASPSLTWGELLALGIAGQQSYDVRVRVDDSFGGVTTSAAASLSVTAEPGDANFDALVDGGDYTIWADHYLQSGQGWTDGDFNGDGVVDGADYTLWADHYSPAPSLAAAVPEPSALVLAALGALVIAADKQRNCLRRLRRFRR